jgi:hypothetical protein
LVDLSVRAVRPGIVLPGTLIAVEGDAFVDEPWGASRLRLRGQADGEDIDVRLPAEFVSYEQLQVSVDDAAFDLLGGRSSWFQGQAFVEVQSAVDGALYASAPIDIAFEIRSSLEPVVERLQSEGVVFANEPIVVEGDGLLLPGEGSSVAVVQGCFVPEGQSACDPVAPQEIPIELGDALQRETGWFAFEPRIAGIAPGRFEGSVTIRNDHVGGTVHGSRTIACSYDLEEPIIYGADTNAASLGQYVTITGAGFVGSDEGSTLLHFEGTFTPDATGTAVPLDEVLLPDVVDGRTARYVINEDDAIGQRLDVRIDTGVFDGTLTPIISYGDDEIRGDASPLQFRLAEVRQVVYVSFSPSYKESLRRFGLRAADDRIRARVIEVIERDFATVNLQVRTTVPEDFAYYAEVDVAGPDPNGLGLLGYDNTPGKDTDNMRLYDRIGGVNALTQQDGYPGFGGVFIESLFGYSSDPNGVTQTMDPDPRFDQLFDGFRPDRGGTPVGADDLVLDIPDLASGESCPTATGERRLEIGCAVWALGNMIGSTVSHEIGHSLGLADPYGPFFHNSGDAPNRLMDSDRPFGERAEIQGEGPSRFCVDEYEYLRAILPSNDDYDVSPRPACF